MTACAVPILAEALTKHLGHKTWVYQVNQMLSMHGNQSNNNSHPNSQANAIASIAETIGSVTSPSATPPISNRTTGLINGHQWCS